MQFAPITEFEVPPPDATLDAPAELVHAIQNGGHSAPLICTRNPATGKLRIKVGVPRYRASIIVGVPELPYVLVDYSAFKLSDAEVARIRTHETK